MSIHRRDLPDAPYRIRKSDFNTQWVWYHFCGHPGSVGRRETYQEALASAFWHAASAHGADLDRLATAGLLKLIRREIGSDALLTKVDH